MKRSMIFTLFLVTLCIMGSETFMPKPNLIHQRPSMACGSTAAPKHQTSGKVVFQKVVRPPSNVEPSLFLPSLVEYLQDHFNLPERLPMVYKDCTQSSDSDDAASNPFVVSWESPLAPDPDCSRLNVQVVAIYGDTKDVNMAMVAVSKSTKTASAPQLMIGLFEESERLILQSLERGLDYFTSSSIRFQTTESDLAARDVSRLQSTEAEPVVDHQPIDVSSVSIDEEASINRPNSPRTSDDDYAVVAARRIAERTAAKKGIEENLGRSQNQMDSPDSHQLTTELHVADHNDTENVIEDESVDLSKIRPPSLDFDNQRAFSRVISRPNDFSNDQKENLIKDRHAHNHKETETTPSVAKQELPDAEKSSDGDDFRGEELASHAMGDMTVEELAAEVLKFGEQNDKENTYGNGFATGAMEKAKELLDSLNNERKLDSHDSEAREDGVDAELRRMFSAGQRMAEERLTRFDAPELTQREKADGLNELEDILASDNSVSKKARRVDTDLAEFEITVNPSPERDDIGNNPPFDVMAGPEVYDRNVDPRVALNWPGARKEPKDMKDCPAELEDAVAQAKFASSILESLVDNDEGYFYRGKQLTIDQVDSLRQVVEEAIDVGLIADPLQYTAEARSLQVLIDELTAQPEERFNDILSNYRGLLLSDNFVDLVNDHLGRMHTHKASEQERDIVRHIVSSAQLLVKEVAAFGAEMEAQQLEVVRSICKVAMDPNIQTEEQQAMALSDAVRDMRSLLDDAFVAYLKYAVAEEKGRLARAGVLDDPDRNQWLAVLTIVQQGVYTEISRGISRYITHIHYILRMETAQERKMLLEKLVDDMPSLDVRPFVQVVRNLVGAVGDSAKGEFANYQELGEMTNKLLQLSRDLNEILPEDRIDRMSRDADEWASQQRDRLAQQQEETRKLLRNARKTEDFDGDKLSPIGEHERFD